MTADRVVVAAVVACAVWATAWYAVTKAIDNYEWRLNETAGEET